MKKIAYLLLISLLFVGCKKTEPLLGSNDIQQFLSSKTGESVEFKNGQWIIGGDGIITYEDALARYNQSLERVAYTEQRRYDFLVIKKYFNIKVYSPVLGYGWDEALDSAIRVWNNQHSSIHFARGSAGAANITVSTWYEQSGAVAFSYYPYNDGKPGSLVQINTYHNDFAFPTKVYAFTHELGHTIGFTHTDGTYGAIITGTPTLDSLSVMNTYIQTWLGLSYYDSIALKTLYP